MTTYKIPEEIIYYVRKKTTVTREASDGDKVEKKVLPARIVDAKSKKAAQNGSAWSKEKYWDYRAQKYIAAGSGKEDKQKNEPKEGYRIFDLEHRGRGGRAYKVITPDDYYIDLREDVLLDTILEHGIGAQGLLHGKFLFAIEGSQMKLIREGSKLHKDAMESNNALKQGKISMKDLEVGTIYSNRSGENKIFLGHVISTDMSTNAGIYVPYGQKAPALKISLKRIKKGLLWYRCYHGDDWSTFKPFGKGEKDAYETWRFDITKTHSMVKKEHALEVYPSVEDVQIKLKKNLIKEFKNIKKDNAKDRDRYTRPVSNHRDQASAYASFSHLVNLKIHNKENRLKGNDYHVDPMYKEYIDTIIVEDIIDA